MGRGQHQCAGWPRNHVCPVYIPLDWTRCRSCQARAEAAKLANVPEDIEAMRIKLRDFEGTAVCVCGGDALAIDHEHSLLHLRYSWAQRQAV